MNISRAIAGRGIAIRTLMINLRMGIDITIVRLGIAIRTVRVHVDIGIRALIPPVDTDTRPLGIVPKAAFFVLYNIYVTFFIEGCIPEIGVDFPIRISSFGIIMILCYT
jgi:hypothetical protein